jgi:hypothetical protein
VITVLVERERDEERETRGGIEVVGTVRFENEAEARWWNARLRGDGEKEKEKEKEERRNV